MFASILAFAKKNKILSAVIALFLLPLLAAALLVLWFFIARLDFGYPGGEINFVGMTRSEVLEFVAKECEKNSSGKIILSIPQGMSCKCTMYKYYNTLGEIPADENIMRSRFLGVNYRSRMMSNYQQELEFDSNNIVVRQKISRYLDGP